MASSNKLRTGVILGSIVVHVGIGVGMFASGVWNIERLDGNVRAPSIAVVLPPMPEASGGPIKLPDVKVTEKERKIITEVTQPEEKKPDMPAKPQAQTQIGDGSGEGSGSGSGSAGDTGTCKVDCGVGSGSAEPKKKEPPPEPDEQLVPPNVLTMNWMTGTKQIHPSDVTKTQMMREGNQKTVGVVKVCISETGRVRTADLMKSTKYPTYDAALLGAVRDWTYRPFSAKGRNVRVCGVVTFVYSIK
jgi:TonB family protein